MKEHGNFSTKAEYEAIPDAPENPSSVLSGKPEFYNDNDRETATKMYSVDGSMAILQPRELHKKGDRIDNRLKNPEQAKAEAYAAKPYMDIAAELYEQYKKEDPEEYEENWKKVDGLEALIALSRDASAEAGIKWQAMTSDERIKADLNYVNPENKPLLEYMQSSVIKGKKIEEIGDDLESVTINPDTSTMQGVLNTLYAKQSQAKTAAERDAAREDVYLMEEFANRLAPDGDSDVGIDSKPADAFLQYRSQHKNSPEDEQQAEDFNRSLVNMNEMKRRNLRDARAYELVKEYVDTQQAESTIVPKNVSNPLSSWSVPIGRSKPVAGVNSKRPTESEEAQPKTPENVPAQEKNIVPDDPYERMKFEREFFVAENMTPENVPVLVDYYKKVLLSNAKEVTKVRKEKNSPDIRYPGMLATLTGRTMDYMYEDRAGAATFLFDIVKDKIKLKSGEPIKFNDFSTLPIDYIFDKLGVDVKEIVPDYEDKFVTR
ncbi:MAG: hypothetical protein JWN75_965 [Candidatus Saccharibacteria bacterium]|nr:hypothetical protein [Candidatus Saccharibacteria bacterium]